MNGLTLVVNNSHPTTKTHAHTPNSLTIHPAQDNPSTTSIRVISSDPINLKKLLERNGFLLKYIFGEDAKYFPNTVRTSFNLENASRGPRTEGVLRIEYPICAEGEEAFYDILSELVHAPKVILEPIYIGNSLSIDRLVRPRA